MLWEPQIFPDSGVSTMVFRLVIITIFYPELAPYVFFLHKIESDNTNYVYLGTLAVSRCLIINV